MTDIKSKNLTPSYKICYNDGKSMTEIKRVDLDSLIACEQAPLGRSSGRAERGGRANVTASLKF